MDLVALNRCSITTQARSHTLQPSAEWNAKLNHCLTPATVNITICQVITLRSIQKYIHMHFILTSNIL